MKLKLVPKELRCKRVYRRVKKEWCGVCGINRPRAIHHILPIAYGGGNDESNLIEICETCHVYAPDDPEQFEVYKRAGGPIIAACRKVLVDAVWAYAYDDRTPRHEDIENGYLGGIMEIFTENIRKLKQ